MQKQTLNSTFPSLEIPQALPKVQVSVQTKMEQHLLDPEGSCLFSFFISLMASFCASKRSSFQYPLQGPWLGFRHTRQMSEAILPGKRLMTSAESRKDPGPGRFRISASRWLWENPARPAHVDSEEFPVFFFT
jgi:hypothetical protein